MNSSRKPELLIFDLGGVFYTLDYERKWSRIRQACGRSYDEIRDILYDDAFIDLEIGRISPFDYFSAVSQKLGCSMLFDDFKEIFNSFLVKREEMFSLLSVLLSKVRIHLLSNTNAINAEVLKKDFEGLQAGTTFSFETGYRKPDPEIFRIALLREGASAGRTLFVDDFEENVRAACEEGFRAHLFTGKTGLLHFLECEGVGIR
jgi:FMN phosphatase YigB (HAD superfamily)